MASANIFAALVCSCSLNLIYSSSLTIDGYYWREFAGVVPYDALPSGKDYNGHPIFVGQTLYDKNVVTSKIYLNDPKAYYGYLGVEYNSTKYVKILCTNNPNKFRWIRTSTADIPSLTDQHLPIGGYEPGNTVYIGRVLYGQETLVGKVVISETDSNEYGLFITSKGRELLFRSFDVLVYNTPLISPFVLNETDISVDIIN